MKCINVFEKAINPRHSLVYVLLLMIAVAMFAPMGVQAQSTRTIDVTITTKDINDAQKVTNYLCHLAPTRSSNGSQRAAAPACDVHSSAQAERSWIVVREYWVSARLTSDDRGSSGRPTD